MSLNQARRHTLSLLAATLLLTPCSTAQAKQLVTLHATLTPEHLGQGTTVGFSFQIATPTHKVPAPLTGIEISYPVELAFALSELGLATCTAQTLEYTGPEGCPANSVMGKGSALAEIPFGPEIDTEEAQVTIFRAQNQSGRIALLIYVDAGTPISEQIALPGYILPANTPYGGRLAMNIPLITTLPEAPDAAIVQFHATLGPLHLHYHEYTHNHLIEYEPKGIPLPNKCPHQGFKFAGTFTFQTGSQSNATTTIPCPQTTTSKAPLTHHHRSILVTAAP